MESIYGSRLLSCTAFVQHAGASVRPSCPVRRASSVRPLCGEWPWVFEQPGRRADLPEEEVFSGFDGLDDLDAIGDEPSSEPFSKVGVAVSFVFPMPHIFLELLTCYLNSRW